MDQSIQDLIEAADRADILMAVFSTSGLVILAMPEDDPDLIARLEGRRNEVEAVLRRANPTNAEAERWMEMRQEHSQEHSQQ